MSEITKGISRRTLLKRAGLAGAAGIAASSTLSRASLAAPGSAGRLALPAFQTGLTGEITVSYADELGKKPPYVDAAAAAVTQANPGAQVKIDLQKIAGGEFYTKLLLALDAGDAPDVIHVGGDRIGELAAAGYIEPLDAYVAEWPDWEQYPQAIKDCVTYDGKIWAIPYGLDTRFLYYRKDVFGKAGLPADWQPANVDAILEAAKAVKGQAQGVIPYSLYAGQAGDSGTASHGFVPLLIAYGGSLQDEAGKWIGSGPAITKALAYYERAWRTDQLVPQEVLTTTKPWTSMREKLGKGELALLFEGGWVYGGWATADPEGTKQNVGYLLHPTETAGPSFTIGGPGTCWYISAKSESKELAWEFIKSFNTAETVAKLNLEDPHPVARADSAALPEFQANTYLVDATKSLETAQFLPPDPNLGKVVGVIQQATGRVATGEASPEEAAERYLDDLKRAVGDDNVVTL